MMLPLKENLTYWPNLLGAVRLARVKQRAETSSRNTLSTTQKHPSLQTLQPTPAPTTRTYLKCYH